ncbi:MAG: hypothetical protein JW932_01600 [Deltaproteobacteria bacterium]|nr:hypothetical protein [Deltaproteobacteria bacterium]
MKEKVLMVALCFAGLIAVFFGMVEDYNGVFIVGITMVVGGYLMMRKRLKESIPGKKEEPSNENTGESKKNP